MLLVVLKILGKYFKGVLRIFGKILSGVLRIFGKILAREGSRQSRVQSCSISAPEVLETIKIG